MTDICDRLEALCRPDRRRKDGQTARRTKETVPCELISAAAREIRELRKALSDCRLWIRTEMGIEE